MHRQTKGRKQIGTATLTAPHLHSTKTGRAVRPSEGRLRVDSGPNRWVSNVRLVTTCFAPQIGDKPDLDKCEQGGGPGPQPNPGSASAVRYLKPFQCSGPTLPMAAVVIRSISGPLPAVTS